jgi:hypothetical protein
LSAFLDTHESSNNKQEIFSIERIIMLCFTEKKRTAALTPSKPFAALTVVILLSFAPVAARAEGAVRVLDCMTLKSCDAAGACKSYSEHTSFRMEPQNLNSDGSGSYIMVHNDERTDMQAPSFAGPFYWGSNDERNTLLANSETEFLWHRLELNPAPLVHIQFMQCVFRQ